MLYSKISLDSDYAALDITGKAACDFLQGQLACDIKRMEPKDFQPTVYCNAQGRVIATLKVCCITPQQYVLWMRRALLPTVHRVLKKYLLSASATITLCERYAITGIIEACEPTAPILSHPDVWTAEHSNHLLYVFVKSSDGNLLDALCNFKETTLENWHWLRLKANKIDVQEKTTGLFTPHSIACIQKGSVSFDKGCFLGQEIINRMARLGKHKRELVSLQFQLKNSKGYPEPAQPVYQIGTEQIVGRIAEVAKDPQDDTQGVCLAVLHKKAFDSNFNPDFMTRSAQDKQQIVLTSMIG